MAVRKDTGKNKKKPDADLSGMSLGQLFELLEGIADRMEKEELSLEDSFEAYKQGIDLIKECTNRIDNVEKEVLKLEEDGNVGILEEI